MFYFVLEAVRKWNQTIHTHIHNWYTDTYSRIYVTLHFGNSVLTNITNLYVFAAAAAATVVVVVYVAVVATVVCVSTDSHSKYHANKFIDIFLWFWFVDDAYALVYKTQSPFCRYCLCCCCWTKPIINLTKRHIYAYRYHTNHIQCIADQYQPIWDFCRARRCVIAARCAVCGAILGLRTKTTNKKKIFMFCDPNQKRLF